MARTEEVDAIVRAVLAAIPDRDTSDRVARCLQDKYGAPAAQAQRLMVLAGVELTLPSERADVPRCSAAADKGTCDRQLVCLVHGAP